MRQALAFLTPFPGARRPSPGALRWFPVVGLALGLSIGGLWWVVARIWPPEVAALIVVGADLALTGMLHFDGLADAADGLLPHLSRERRLEVMREPTVGAFGVVVVALVILTRWATLAALRPSPLLLGALWCTSRGAMAATIGRVPYARREPGLPGAFMGSRVPTLLVAATVVGSLALSSAWKLPAGPVAVAAAVGAFALVVVFAVRRVGGFTGDVLGAAGVVGETVGLLVAAAKW